MPDSIDDFLVQQSFTPSTRWGYRHYLELLSDWLAASGRGFAELDGPSVVRWLDEHPTWGNQSRHLATAAMRGFIRWNFGESHPALRVRFRRLDPSPQRTLSKAEVQQLLAYLEPGGPGSPRYASRVRNYALVTLLLDTGLRATEVCNLLLEHVDLERRMLRVRIKGGKWGQAVFSPLTRVRLEAWLAVRSECARPNVHTLFVSTGGHTPGEKMSRDGLRTIFRRMARAAGLPHFSPHSMRRSFACLAIEAGAPTRLVQIAGRWKNIAMVETYTQALSIESFAPFSPVEAVAGGKP